MSNQLSSNEAFDLDQRLKALKKTVEASGLIMGRILYEIQEKGYYTILGYDTFESYLADPELSFKRSTAYNLKKIYKQWVLDYGYEIDELRDVGYERLLEAGKVATDNTKGEWLEKAKTLSRSDLNASVKELQGEEVEDFIPFPRLKRCPKCKKWIVMDLDYLCDGLCFPQSSQQSSDTYS